MAKFASGKYTVKNPAKYAGNKTPMYRSSWEWAFMQFCDNHPGVIQWASEAIKIPYKNPLTGKNTIYVPDFIVVYQDKNGKKRAECIEVKPKKEISVPNQITKKLEEAAELVKSESEIEVENKLDTLAIENPEAEVNEEPVDTIYNFEDTLITAMDSMFIKYAQDNFNDTTYDDVSELLNDTIIESGESEITIRTEEIIASEKVFVLDLEDRNSKMKLNDESVQQDMTLYKIPYDEEFWNSVSAPPETKFYLKNVEE